MAALAALAIFAGSVSASAQATSGTVTGKVTDVGTGAPLASVNVRVTGTQIGAQTATDGVYTIRGVTPGSHDVQVNRIGYEAKHISVTVAAGQTATANVQLTQAAFSLATVVTTVTGAQSKAEMTNSVATLDVSAKADESSAQNLGQMLSGQAAGVQVSSSGAAGAGSRIRIRGQNSLSSSNNPVVYIDGVKVSSASQSGSNSQPSRFDDIDPSEIESIDVLKGPSAATLYGTEAANGVILITTKKGKAGTTRVSVFNEDGITHDPSAGHYRDLWEGFDLSQMTNKVGGQCTLVQEPTGACTIDSLAHNNPLNAAATTPIVNGYNRDFGMQVSGGSTQSQYFLSGEYNNTMGDYKMPQSEIDRLTVERGQAPLDNQIYPNADRRINLRSNLSGQLGSKADVSASIGYLNRADRQPRNEDDSQGLMVDAIAGTEATNQVDARGIPLNGYRTFPIGDILSQNQQSWANRYTTSLSARYYPLSWLNMRGNFGYDYTGLHQASGEYFGQGPCCGSTRQGSVSDSRNDNSVYTIDVGATATTGLWRSFGSKLSVGSQAYRTYSQTTGSGGITLPPGATTPGQTATPTANNSTSEGVTLGNYVDETVSYSDEFYLDMAARYDGNSAFGEGFNGVWYPHFGATWTMSQANWFPKTDKLSEFRVRFSDGTSGVQPQSNDATRYYSTSKLNYFGIDQPGVRLNSVGNNDLKPEYSTEWETGFDATVLNNHTTIEVNYFHHKTRDALISAPLAPSLSGLTSVTENLGSVKNTGFEYTLNNRIIDNSQVGLDIQLTGSTNHNTLLTLGQGITPVPGGTRNEELSAPGYPLFGYWGKTYTYNDANGDGILVPSEMTLGDTAIFIGASYPTIEMALNPRLELLHRKLAIAMQFDHKEGMIKYNNTLRHQCSTGGQSCQGLYNIASGLDWQAKAQADNTFSDYRGMYENGKFTRLREVSVSYQLADKLAAKVHSSRALLVVTGRNLAVWTPFSGVDPESTVGNTDTRGNEEYFATPPLRQFTVRLNLTF